MSPSIYTYIYIYVNVSLSPPPPHTLPLPVWVDEATWATRSEESQRSRHSKAPTAMLENVTPFTCQFWEKASR